MTEATTPTPQQVLDLALPDNDSGGRQTFRVVTVSAHHTLDLADGQPRLLVHPPACPAGKVRAVGEASEVCAVGEAFERAAPAWPPGQYLVGVDDVGALQVLDSDTTPDTVAGSTP